MLRRVMRVVIYPHRKYGYGGIGRRSGLKIHWETVWVQIPLSVPFRGVAQLEERRSPKPLVVCSTHTSPAIMSIIVDKSM